MPDVAVAWLPLLSRIVNCADIGMMVPVAELGVRPQMSATAKVGLVPPCVSVFGVPPYVYCTFHEYQRIVFGPCVKDVDAS